MADKTKIEWAEATWNPVTGCTKVSPGCDHCYAETFAERFRGVKGHPYAQGFDLTLRPERLDQPLRWKRPRRVFVNSMSDLFHDDIPDEYIAQVFAVMALAPQHTFQVLTKRHGRMRSLLNDNGFRQAIADRAADRNGIGSSTAISRTEVVWPLPNVWLGVSVEDQKWADIRIPALLDTPAAVRWLSCEPLTGPVDLKAHWLRPTFPGPRVVWVVVGGESGPGARPMHPDWARSLRDQCVAAAVPYFLKQWGEWAPWATYFAADKDERGRWDAYVNPDGTTGEYAISEDHDLATNWTGNPTPGNAVMSRVGKKRAGRMLDGRTWDEYPLGPVGAVVDRVADGQDRQYPRTS